MLTAHPDEPPGAESLEGVGGLLNYLKTLQQLSSLFCSLFFGDQTLLKNIKIISVKISIKCFRIYLIYN